MYLLLVIQQLIASGTHVVAKSLTHNVPAPVVLFFRAISVSLLFSIYFLFIRKKLKKIEKKDIGMLMLLGIMNIPINQFLFLTSLEYTSAPNVALAYALTPAFVLLISTMFYNEKPSRINTIGIITAILGTIIILLEKGLVLNSDGFKGDIIALMASLSWGFYTIWGKDLAQKYGAIYITGLSMIIGLFAYIPIFYFLPAEIQLENISAVNWMQILYLGLLTSGVGYAIWNIALKKIDASKVSVFNNLQPILTAVLSVFFLEYVFTGYFVVGGILVIIGVFLAQRG